jgi:ribosomal protein S18 acetylase RimI-like enzyme
MRQRLGEALEQPTWPSGVHLQSFTENRASEVHALLTLAYANRGGSVPSFDEWWRSLSADCEYDSNLCFLACDEEGSLIGFAQCWTSAFVKDVVVHPRFRRLGVGKALLLHIFRVFQERGATAVDLKVVSDNPTGAILLYESVGMLRISNYSTAENRRTTRC